MKLTLKNVLQEGGWQAGLEKNKNNNENEFELEDNSETEEPQNKLPGGKGDKLSPSDVDQEQLMKGIHVEFEHTKDIMIAMEIALDHLSENPQYYSELEKIDPHK